MPITHRHQWKVSTYVLLYLPIKDSAERCWTYVCPCGASQTITGFIQLGHPLHTAAYWQGIRDDEQRRATAEAVQAAKEQRYAEEARRNSP